jgi:pimeloyl-ACP methyl ester carboxylesterase
MASGFAQKQYWLRLLGFFVSVLTVALATLPLLIGAGSTFALLYMPCHDSNVTPAEYGYAWEDIIVQTRAGDSFRGYFISGANGATVIMPPAMASGRGSRLHEAAVLLRHGYAVFAYESRRCAGQGPLTLGFREVEDVADAVDYLVTRPDVDPERIGVHGFSSAGATAIMATARLPALRAVVAEGGYGDFVENTIGSSNACGLTAYFELGFSWSTQLTYRLITGLDMDQLSPRRVISDIAPRPILLIYGSRERSLIGGRQQKAAAGTNAELWIVPEAGHGNYLTIAPEAYEARVVEFFDQALR